MQSVAPSGSVGLKGDIGLVELPFLVEDLGGGVSCTPVDVMSSPDDDDEVGDSVFFFVGVVLVVD